MSRYLVPFLFVLLIPTGSSAQESAFTVFVRPIHDTTPTEQEHEQLTAVATSFRSALELRGLLGESNQGQQLYVSLREVIESGQELLLGSISHGGRLSPAAIDAGVEHQIFYAGQQSIENPEEGRFVREYMTREVLEELIDIFATDLLLIPKTQLDLRINEYLDEWLDRTACYRDDSC